MSKAFIHFFSCGHPNGESILRRRNRTGGKFGKCAGRIICFIKIYDISSALAGFFNYDEPACPIGFYATGSIRKNGLIPA